jgi:Transposase DDE domain
MSNNSEDSAKLARGGAYEQIESFLQTVMKGLMEKETPNGGAEPSNKPGHPVILPSLSLWMAVLVGVLRGLKSIRAIWRLLAAGGWWRLPCYDIEDQAVYKRLEQEGWKPLAQLFERISLLLVEFLQPALQAYHQRHAILAPFATEVIALDEMHLDQVSRRLPILRHFKKGDAQLLPGKLVALFDVRLQQWRAIDYIAQASENGLEVASALLLRSMKQGALLLADLGYFGFEWFDELTEQGYSWISRVKGRTTVIVLHTYYEAEDTFDRLVWLGASSTKGKYAVRQVQFWQGGQLRQYFTNVCDPTVLPLLEIARLYARRWDIELAFLTLKRELGLHLIWSSKQVVVLAQVWACLIIAQVLQAIRMEVALRAEVDAFEVSLPLLIEALPQFGSQGRDGIVECVRQGRRLGIIRPSTRLCIEAPEIPRERLVPVPKESVLCRQPHYHQESSRSDKQGSPNIEVHPERDRIVEILRQREALIRAAARQAKGKLSTRPTQPKTKTPEGSISRVVVRPIVPVQPDPGIARPPWPHLRPLVAAA